MLRKKKSNDTLYKFVLTPRDLCIKPLFALKVTRLWPLKRKYWTPTHIFIAFLTLLSSFSFTVWFVLLFFFYGNSFGLAVTIDISWVGGLQENWLRSARSLIFDGLVPHEFPIAFHTELMMCMRLQRIYLTWSPAHSQVQEHGNHMDHWLASKLF